MVLQLSSDVNSVNIKAVESNTMYTRSQTKRYTNSCSRSTVAKDQLICFQGTVQIHVMMALTVGFL